MKSYTQSWDSRVLSSTYILHLGKKFHVKKAKIVRGNTGIWKTNNIYLINRKLYCNLQITLNFIEVLWLNKNITRQYMVFREE